MSRAQGNPGFWHTYPDRQHWPDDEHRIVAANGSVISGEKPSPDFGRGAGWFVEIPLDCEFDGPCTD